MAMTNKQLAVLHVAKSKLGLSDNQYRAALVDIAGVTSSKELDKAGFEALLGFFEYLGFAPLKVRGADYGDRPGMASFAQIELIRALWAEHTKATDEGALNKWMQRFFHTSSLRFLTSEKAGHVITALKQMKRRAS